MRLELRMRLEFFLLEAGADASLRTGRDKKGDNALRLLESSHGTNHPAVALLQQYAAKGVGREETTTRNTARSELYGFY